MYSLSWNGRQLFKSIPNWEQKLIETSLQIHLVNLKGLKNTAKGNFGGGNTDWEDRKLGSYLTSETRFEEVLEGSCKSDQVYHRLEDLNYPIEILL